MIATCPACGKRYRLADEAVPAGGRNVRCAACGHGWVARPDGHAADGVAPLAEAVAPAAGVAASQPEQAVPAAEPGGAAAADPELMTLITSKATRHPDFADDRAAPASPVVVRPRRRRHIGWLAAVFALLAVGALAVIEFAPASTFDPPRLGLPAPHLPLADLGSVSLPSLPPLDLTRVPVVGDRLDALVHPAPAPPSPLRITARGERHRLANGTWLLTVSGTVANPTAAPVTLSGIDAALVDPAGTVAFRWHVAAPASVVAAHGSAAFETTAANFPPDTTILRLRAK